MIDGVSRYDHRDTGQSVAYAPGAPPYSLRDLAADAVGILEASISGARISSAARWAGESPCSRRSAAPIAWRR
jgi:hypothetical protein